MPARSTPAFVKRINKAAREEDYDADHRDETGEWVFKGNTSLPSLGSLFAPTPGRARLQIWPHAATLPLFRLMAGGTKTRFGRLRKGVASLLIVTISTPETDIYTPVAADTASPCSSMPESNTRCQEITSSTYSPPPLLALNEASLESFGAAWGRRM